MEISETIRLKSNMVFDLDNELILSIKSRAALGYSSSITLNANTQSESKIIYLVGNPCMLLEYY